MIDWIGVVSHYIRSLLGAIELTFLYAFICMIRYFYDRIGETILYNHMG